MRTCCSASAGSRCTFPSGGGWCSTGRSGMSGRSTASILMSSGGRPYGLVGESGCGKSTLGRAILRLEEPTGGSVLFDGQDIASLKPEDLRRARRRMQMVFQDPLASLNPRQSVESLMVEPLKVHGLSAADVEEFGSDSPKSHLAKALSMLEVVNMPRAALAKYPHEFSGGQRQRIGIARAMILNPDLVIADEPVSALDVSVQAQVINLLERLQDMFGLTYIVIAHDLAVVRHISDTDRGDVSRPAGRAGAERRPVRQPAAPVHDRPDVGDPHPRSRGRGQPRADPAQGRPAQPGQPAQGMPLPHPLPLPAADPMRHRGARAARRSRVSRKPSAGWPVTTPSRS